MEFKELSREHRRKKYMATYTNNITKVCILVIYLSSFDFLFCTNYSHLHAKCLHGSHIIQFKHKLIFHTLWRDENRIFFVRSPHHKHFGKAQHLVL